MIGTAFDCAGSSQLCKFFSNCSEQGLLSGCGTWASRPGGFSCCGAPRCVGSVVEVPGL